VAESRRTEAEAVDPRAAGATAKGLPSLAARNYGGIGEAQETARQWAQKFLFFLIAFGLGFLALFDAALLLPAVHLETKIILAVNGVFGGASGLLGLCATYILAPYKRGGRR
jgi:hypothetical protein